MEIVEIPIQAIRPAAWNANETDPPTRQRLRRSLELFGCKVPLVLREISPGQYETIGGAQRLSVLAEMGATAVPCIVVEANDVQARLLSQALNRISGEDNLGLRAELMKRVLEHVSPSEVLALLPETPASLQDLSTLGQAQIAEYLAAKELARSAKLRHSAFQLTDDEWSVVDRAVSQAVKRLKGAKGANPNLRGRAFAAICEAYLARKRLYAAYRGGAK